MRPVHTSGEQLLDDPISATLNGFHADLAQTRGRVQRFPDDVSPFMALPADPTPQEWATAADLTASSGAILFSAAPYTVPQLWTPILAVDVVQMVSENVGGEPDTEAVVLGAADVPEALALVAATRPGPFASRTIELGTYLGLRDRGELVAMAGERMRAPGWTEISAICTARSHRGRGLATRLIHTLIGNIDARGERVFLHVAVSNRPAINLYRHLGFRERRLLTATGLGPVW